MTKRHLFEVFLDRMTKAEAAGMPLEAAWYAYAILEDRLVSMLRNSGGVLNAKGEPIDMMGPKMVELRRRAKSDPLLAANFPEHDIQKMKQTKLGKWKDARNNLMHKMANGDSDLEKIDGMVSRVAADGAELAREYAAAAARLKKHRQKVPLS